MNALSWMIYAAEVSDSIRWFVWFTTIASFLFGVFVLITTFSCLVASEERYVKDTDKENYKLWAKKWLGLLKISVPILVVSFFVASFLPSKQTIMLIAASQIGESFLNTDAAKNIGGVGLDTVNNLNDYLKSLIPKPEPDE